MLLATGVQHLDPRAAAPIAPRLQRTTLATFGGMAASAESVPPPATSAVAPAPPPPPSPTPETFVSTDAGVDAPWTIVLASVPEESAARREAERLRASGLDTRVVEATRGDGGRTWRVVAGRYADKAAAAEDIASIRKRRGLARAWIAQQP
jgi:cell division septation protein DedD